MEKLENKDINWKINRKNILNNSKFQKQLNSQLNPIQKSNLKLQKIIINQYPLNYKLLEIHRQIPSTINIKLLPNLYHLQQIKMKSVFLVSNNQFPLNLTQISSSLYYQPTKNQFYRLNVMPSCTVFASEDVQKRQLMVLNKIDPLFLMINKLQSDKKIKQQNLQLGLRQRKWELISNVELVNDKKIYSWNKQKVYDILEKKVAKMESFLYQNNPLDRIKLLQFQDKTISADTIVLLKNQLNNNLVDEFTKQRYNYNQNRKRQPSPQQQVTKAKPSKNNKKPADKPQSIPKNQSTLFGFMKKPQ